MLQSLEEIPPPSGDLESWKQKTGVLVKAAADGEEAAGAALKKAANCQVCHRAHKGKPNGSD